MKKTLAILLLAACGPGSKPTTPLAQCTPGPETPLALSYPEGFDTDSSKLGTSVADGWQAMAQVESDGVVYALVTLAQCDVEPRCDPHVLRIVDGTATARAPLPGGEPAHIPGDAPFEPHLMELADRDGDGTPELWVGHGMFEELQDENGISQRSYLTMFSPDDLAVRWHAEMSSSTTVPESTELEIPGKYESCDRTLASVDADCDGDLDVVANGDCCLPAVIDPWAAESLEREAAEREELGEEVDWDAVDAEIEDLKCPERSQERTVYARQPDGTFQKI